MFCQNCGTNNYDTSIFCCECGTRLNKLNLEKAIIEEAKKEPELEGNENDFLFDQLEDLVKVTYGNIDFSSLNTKAAKPKEPKEPGVAETNKLDADGTNETYSDEPGDEDINIKKYNSTRNKNNFHKIPKIFYVIATELVAIIVLIVATISGAKECYSPKTVASNYFANIVNGDFDAAYDMLDIPNEVFLSKEFYIQSMKQRTFGDISQYQVSDEINVALDWLPENTDTSSLGNTYYVTYKTTGGSYDDYYEVDLTKKDSKKMLFFDDWSVISASTWKKNVSVLAPAGSNVMVDDIDISIYKGNTNEYGQDVYTIPYLFNGQHKINISSEERSTVEDIFDAGYGYELTSSSYTADAIKEMQAAAVENIKKIYGAATSDQSFDEIKDLFYIEDGSNEDYENLYIELVNYFKNNNVTKIKFDSFTTKNDKASDQVHVSLEGMIEYYQSDEDGKIIKSESELDSELEIALFKKDGKWLQTNFGCDTFQLY